MNSIISSEPISWTGYGTRAPAVQSAERARNSAVAHWPESSSRPNAVRVAMARVSRDRRIRRPSV